MNQKPIVISSQTKEKVEAAKIFIEQRYSRLIQQEIEKRQYWDQLNQKMKDINLDLNQRQQIKNNILHQQAGRMRNERTKITILDFEPIKIIGKGAFGQVRLCRWKKTKQPVAVKKLKKHQMIFKNKIIQVREQRNVLANSDKNPWIVGLKCSFQDADNLYLVMDYVPGGDLMNLLIKKDIFTHDQARFYIAEMILAINSVHQLNYIHRDIKPDNILIDQKGHIKLSDFGLCKHTEMRPKKLLQSIRKIGTSKQKNQVPKTKYQQNQQNLTKHQRRKLAYSAVGTPDYVAPEVQGKNGYTETVDWWSLGVIFYEMLVGYPPFASEQSSITWQKIQNWKKFLVIPKDAYVSPQAADLIRKLIADPQNRLGVNGVQQIMNHRFFANVNWKEIRQTKAPNIPVLKNPYDTCNFDPFEEEQPWISMDSKQRYRNKKGTQFIGYTFKPEEQANSELIKALVDLDKYRQPPQQLHRNNVESLYLEPQTNINNRVFKKQSINGQKKQFYATTSTLLSPKYSSSIRSPANNNIIGSSNKPSINSYVQNNNYTNGNLVQGNFNKAPSPAMKKIEKKPQSPNVKQQKKAVSGLNIGVKVKVTQKKPLDFQK